MSANGENQHGAEAERLAGHWQAIYRGAGDAIQWIGNVRASAPRLDSEADHLVLKLRRVRNTAKRLGAVTPRPMTVGFFGLSQAGKSYLISVLAAGANGKLETIFGGNRLDFIDHVNPPGGGKEATGLVTRFSRTATAGPSDYPIELRLFSELEIARILANSFFKDFNVEKFQYEYSEAKIRQTIKELTKKSQHQPVSGVTEDDVVGLWDYLKDRFPSSLKMLDVCFWPEAVSLAPYLSLEDRGRLFSVLWGEIPEFTETYSMFARVLAQLGHPERVFAPLDVLVSKTPQGGLSQADSIMNVDMLERLGRSIDKAVQVRPEVDSELQAPVSLSLAQLAALTTELVFPLVERTSEPLFEEVDLLDFPGYRGRLKVESLEDVRRQVKSDEANPVAQLFLRGKVAYLFERYTDSQEMNVLIVCTPSNYQSEVTEVGPVLTEWIARTQGATPEIRSRRSPGLLWAITKFDLRIADLLPKTEDNLRIQWGAGGMMRMTMLERFNQYPWLQEWAPGRAFDNTFLMRKPRVAVPFLKVEGGVETGVNTSVAPQLALMKKTFAEDEAVRTHIHDAEAAWDGMMALNDGGMARMASYLRKVASRKFKLERSREQMEELVHDLVEANLARWYQAEGAGEVEKKKKLAQEIANSIRARALLFGDLLQRMQISDDTLRTLYLRVEEEVGEDASAAQEGNAASGGALNLGGDLINFGGDFDLFGGGSAEGAHSAAPTKPVSATSEGSDARFARVAFREWIHHLRNLPGDQRLMQYFGYPRAQIEALIDELVTAANRMNLQSHLLNVILGTEQAGTKRSQLVDRQVLIVQAAISDFIAWLGFVQVPPGERPESLVNRGVPIFSPPATVEPNRLPQLPSQPINHSAFYLYDWLVAFSRVAISNAGHSAGREITPEQNDALGKIIALLTSTRSE
ncbi:similar to uncharacterized protein conserved in bacteria, putative virulence factor (SrfC) [gamma proteobacterium HdN1]|nr:similar to uncharacterized protein conserved in bacteria, putative virulence factor (SrfC) [gamma proteobacterium HdN1]